MNDPSDGVPPQLLPHIHLLSSYRYPPQAHISIESVVEYLKQAPKITRDIAPMTWQFLDCPADGTVLLKWQPLTRLGTVSASDGYIWMDAEQAFSSEVKGYTVEMYVHRTGCRANSNEQLATHGRRRYRLINTTNPGNPPPDPSLWIVHYCQAEPQYRIPANRLQIPAQIQQSLSTRRHLQSQGQLVRKEFMFHDRHNWPTINMPGGNMPLNRYGAPAPGFAPRSQTGPYPNGTMYGDGGPPPAKRPRQTPPSHASGVPGVLPSAGHLADTTFEEDEDTSRGDLLDHLTPREISLQRFQQHTEWMEEIFSSPYPMNQIVPVDLGLGLKGELEWFTKGIFEPPSGDPQNRAISVRAGKLDPEKASDFKKRAEEGLAKLDEEIEKIKQNHAKNLNRFGKTTIVKDAEHRLRTAVNEPDSTGTEIWRIEGRLDEVDPELDIHGNAPTLKPKEKVEDIVQQVEKALHKHIEVAKDLKCVQKGGLEETKPPRAEKPDNSSTSINQSAFEMEDIDMGMDDGVDTVPQPSAASAPPVESSSGPQEPAQQVSSVIAPSEQQAQPTPSVTAPVTSQPSVDVQMSDMQSDAAQASAQNDNGEWVMVSREDNDNNADKPKTITDLGSGATISQPVATPGATIQTPASGNQGLTPAGADISVPETDQDTFGSADFADFANLDSAGDALASYEEQGHDLDLGDQSGLDLDDSAFGDAFHGAETPDN